MRLKHLVTTLALALAGLLHLPSTATAYEDWLDLSFRLTGTPSRLAGAAFGNGQFLLISGNANIYYTSPAGVSDWTERTTPLNVAWRGVAFGGGTFVIAGAAGAVCTSTTGDADSWTTRSLSEPTKDCTGLRRLAGKFLIGRSPTLGATPGESYSHLDVSADGATWTPKTFALYGDGGTPIAISDIAFKPGITPGSGTWVLASENVAEKLIVANEDFTQASVVTVPGMGLDQRVTYGEGRFVLTADGASGQVWSSTDGTNWTQASLPLTTPGLPGLFHDGETFVVAGSTIDSSSPARPAILHSVDGLTWNRAADIPGSSRNLQFVYKADGLWIAGGVNKTMFTSGRTTYSLAEIEVRQASTVFENKSSTLTFAEVTYGQTSSENVTVRNIGTQPLTVGVATAGTDRFSWQVGTLPSPLLLQPGQETTVSVTFSALSPGVKNAVLRIITNDNDENPFDLGLSGEVLVAAPPTILTQPLSQLLRVDDEAFMSAQVRQGGTYQWYKGTAPLPNTNSASLSISPLKTTNAGIYSLRVRNDSGSAESDPVVLGVVSNLPATASVSEGGTLTLTAAVTLPPGLTPSYRWYFRGSSLNDGGATTNTVAGATTKTLKVSKAVSPYIGGENGSAEGTYFCEITVPLPDTYGGGELVSTTSTCEVLVAPRPVLSPSMSLPAVRVAQQVNASVSLASVRGGPAKIGPISYAIPHKFTATGLPPGIVLNAATGAFTGQATAARLVSGNVVPYRVKITVTNSAGSTSGEYDWLVNPLAPFVYGSHTGFIDRHDSINGEFGGLLQMKIEPSGRYTGTLTLAGVRHPFTGSAQSISSDQLLGAAIIKRIPATLGNLTFDFTINQGYLTGNLTDETFGNHSRPGNHTLTEAAYGLAQHPATSRLLMALPGSHSIASTSTSTFSPENFAGIPYVSGFVDGSAEDALFNAPEGLCALSSGVILVADTGNHAIRRITAAGAVETIAGSGAQGAQNGTGSAATFNQPCALAADPAGNIIVVDRGNHTLRRITPAGVVTTFAGSPGVAGFANGAGAAARFDSPNGIVYEPVTKCFYVTDLGNAVVRKVTLTGAVTTHAGSPKVEGGNGGLLANCRFNSLRSIATDGAGHLYVGDSSNVYQISPTGLCHVTYEDTSGFSGITGLCRLSGGDLAATFPAQSRLWYLRPSEGTRTSLSTVPAPWTATNKLPAGYVGYHTLAFGRQNVAHLDGPLGEGYATLTTTTAGLATWAGKLADGSTFTGSFPVGETGEVPFHAMLYTNRGSIQGSVNINPANGAVTTPNMPATDWFKLPQPATPLTRSYTNGFFLLPLQMTGGRYVKTPAPNLASLLTLPAGPDNLVINVGNVFNNGTAFSVTASVSPTGVITVPTSSTANPNQLKLTFAAATGILTGSYTLPAQTGVPARKCDFSAILLTREAYATGHHLQPQLPEPGQTPTTTPILSGRVIVSGPN